jgi:RimJ/RimL family protein N-acetyltransferase
MTLAVDYHDQSCVGYLALLDIDWDGCSVGGLSVRIHPDWCERGLGTRALRALVAWALSRGFASLHLDVVATNLCAIHCYEKVGFTPIAEVWRVAHDLDNADLSAPELAFLKPHIRPAEGTVELRFLVMRVAAPSACPLRLEPSILIQQEGRK